LDGAKNWGANTMVGPKGKNYNVGRNYNRHRNWRSRN
jgi:hypothetical protein